jgi:GAF domain-containing protein/HAMP domain-containing protein
MTSDLNPQNDIKRIDEHLAETLFAGGRYNALFIGVVAIGFITIYLLTQYGVLGEPAPQLLFIGGAVFFMAVSQAFTMFLARRKKGILARMLGGLFTVIFAILITSFWEGVAFFAIILIFIPPITAIVLGMPNRYRTHLYILIIAGIIGILRVNANPPIDRLQTGTIAAISSLVFLGATGLLLITVTVISQSRRYRNLRSQLLTSLIIIVTIPILMSTFLSAIGAYINNQSQTFGTLRTISNLKVNQAEDLITGFKNDLTAIQLDTNFKRNALLVLSREEIPLTQLAINRSFARLRLTTLQSTKEQPYREIMVLDTNGDVEISTTPEREGENFQSEAFYSQGSTRTFVGFSNNAKFSNGNLVVSAPIYNDDGKIIRGILVLRADAILIKNIMETTPGFEEAETYLLDTNFRPVTKTRTPVNTVVTDASLSAVLNNVTEGAAIYENYMGTTVIGDYQWIDSLEMVFIAEVPLSSMINNVLGSIVGSASLALFAIIIAIAAVAISADSISNPISALAETTKSFAAGQLSTRASINREDEIGDLSRAYNQMAEQLQNIIGKLEQRVTDRTKELEDQSNRLRVAVEIARDAASSRDLTGLLEQAGELIHKRFGFYHTGIFLLDNNREFAVLTSSPTDSGKQMIANNHKLRVGEVGIVGRVAATGEPRITLDTGLDAIHFNNPLLPYTRSEMALPLKVQNNLIGVLDVQSEQPQAFNEEDVAIMQLMADQLATAIERTRLLQQVEQNLSDLEQAYGRFTREGWKALDESGLLGNAGYRFDNVRIQPINEPPSLGSEAIQAGNTVMNNNDNKSPEDYTVAIPIKLRGHAIGVVTAKLKEGYNQTTISTIELAIERLAASLESARLYEEARMRADREQSISHVTTAITSSTEYEEILRTTVREIGNVLGNTEVAIQILGDPDGQGSGR